MPPASESWNLPRAPSRWALAAGALALAAAALLTFRADERDRRELLARADAGGVAGADLESLARRLEREADPGERRLAAAAALLAPDRSRTAPDPAARRAERLLAAERLAGDALDRLPASWNAPRLLGAALVERRLAARDTRLFSAAHEWERALTVAAGRTVDPGRVESTLARAYLEVWPALSEGKRPVAEAILARAFRDPGFLERHFARWLAVAGSPAAAAELLPDHPRSWAQLADATWRAGDLAASAGYRRRERRALRESLDRRLTDALRAPDRLPRGLDEELSTIVAAAPLGRDFAPLVERAVLERPPGPARDELAEAAGRWLEWALPLCRVGACPLAGRAIDRLASAAGSRLDEPRAAVAALAAGDERRANRLARRSQALWSEAWAPYLVLAARRRLDAGEKDEARELLGEVHRSQRLLPTWRALWTAAGGAAAAIPEEAAAGPPWQPNEWRVELGAPALELAAPRAAPGLRVGFHLAPESAGLVLVEWDGEVGEPRLVRPGSTDLRLELAVAPGLHLLRLRPLVRALPELGVTTLE